MTLSEKLDFIREARRQEAKDYARSMLPAVHKESRAKRRGLSLAEVGAVLSTHRTSRRVKYAIELIREGAYPKLGFNEIGQVIASDM